MDKKAFTRRGFVSVIGKFAFVSASLILLGRSFTDKEVKARRPPGAVSEPLFSALCLRCGSCAEACPEKIIRPLPISYGLKNLNTPVLTPEGVCTRDLACIEACPNGALQKITTEDLDIGTAVIIEENCTNCGLCIHPCREIVDAIKWTTPEKKNIYIDSEICIGCGACIPDCPNDALLITSEKAIRTKFQWR